MEKKPVGRPPKKERLVKFNGQIPQDIFDKIDSFALERSVTKNKVYKDAFELYFKTHEEIEK